jgi:hypothetical protein
MSKRVLAILVAALLAVGIFSAVANAGVEGDFTFWIWLWPQTTAYEAAGFYIDFEGDLNLNLVISGLTIGNHASFGIAGLENYFLTLDTTLGFLDVHDEFVFAVPYINCPDLAPGKYWYINYFTATGPFIECQPVGDLLFVKKRVGLEATIGGLTLSTLILFEDVNFPAPWDTGPSSYGSTDQDFNFGAIVGFSGQTVSGINITAKSGFCADWTIRAGRRSIGKYLGPRGWVGEVSPGNAVKKGYWDEVVCESGELGLTKEFISITNISFIPNMVLNTYTLMTLIPAFAYHTFAELVYTLPMNLGKLYTYFDLAGGLSLGGPANTMVLLALDNFQFLWADLDNDFSMTAGDIVTGVITFDVQNTSFLAQGLFVPTKGISRLLIEADIPISYPEPIGNLEINALWVKPATGGGVVFDAIDIDLSKSFGEHNTFQIDAQFGAKGLRAVGMSIGVSFSL